MHLQFSPKAYTTKISNCPNSAKKLNDKAHSCTYCKNLFTSVTWPVFYEASKKTHDHCLLSSVFCRTPSLPFFLLSSLCHACHWAHQNSGLFSATPPPSNPTYLYPVIHLQRRTQTYPKLHTDI